MIHDVLTQIVHDGIIIHPWKNIAVALQHIMASSQVNQPSVKDLEFLDGVLLRARDVLIHNLVWQHVFTESDCPPALHGLAVDISAQDRKQDMYCLELGRANRGPEFELTQVYGFQRAISSGEIDIRFRVNRPNQFQIDLAAVIDVLRVALPSLDTTAASLIDQLKNTSALPSMEPYPILILKNKDLSIIGWLKNVAPRFSGALKTHDSWQFKGTTVTGQLLSPHPLMTNQLPLLQIQILPAQLDPGEYFGWRRFATSTELAFIINLTTRIAREFRSQSRRNRWSNARAR